MQNVKFPLLFGKGFFNIWDCRALLALYEWLTRCIHKHECECHNWTVINEELMIEDSAIIDFHCLWVLCLCRIICMMHMNHKMSINFILTFFILRWTTILNCYFCLIRYYAYRYLVKGIKELNWIFGYLNFHSDCLNNGLILFLLFNFCWLFYIEIISITI